MSAGTAQPRAGSYAALAAEIASLRQSIDDLKATATAVSLLRDPGTSAVPAPRRVRPRRERPGYLRVVEGGPR